PGISRAGREPAPAADGARPWRVPVRAPGVAARAGAPGIRARGEGYLLNTASAAGPITSLPSATYAATKHAADALAEWHAIQHGDAGVRVSVLCPQAVATPMIQDRAGAAAAANDGVISAEALADCVVDGMDAESFLILPHPQVLDYFRRKGSDYDRWLGGMRRFARQLGSLPDPGPR
ncbi:MAG: SDR family oxidoreductase, partial [Burkholderiales bacterium]